MDDDIALVSVEAEQHLGCCSEARTDQRLTGIHFDSGPRNQVSSGEDTVIFATVGGFEASLIGYHESYRLKRGRCFQDLLRWNREMSPRRFCRCSEGDVPLAARTRKFLYVTFGMLRGSEPSPEWRVYLDGALPAFDRPMRPAKNLVIGVAVFTGKRQVPGPEPFLSLFRAAEKGFVRLRGRIDLDLLAPPALGADVPDDIPIDVTVRYSVPVLKREPEFARRSIAEVHEVICHLEDDWEIPLYRVAYHIQQKPSSDRRYDPSDGDMEDYCMQCHHSGPPISLSGPHW
eukprot:m.155260 g.155260  ORF g.155260 m.155260 type:complete len:288 (-) comp9797_c0_seq17:74-937(-)